MATTKKAAKKSTKKPVVKKPAAKKAAAKKPAAKKAVKKSAKPAAKKSAAKKPAAKPAKKAAKKAPAKKATKPAKKPAAKKPAKAATKVPAKKAATPKAKKPKATSAAPAVAPQAAPAPIAQPTSSFVPPTAFTPLFVSLEEWANTGKLGEFDFEAYQSFNEQYKPSDWNQNPKMNEVMFTFAMDGTGGQFSIWQDGSSDNLEELPVVLLGSEGSTLVLASSVPEFFYIMAGGVDPSQIEYEGIKGDERPNVDFMVFVKKQWPGRTFARPKEIYTAAKQKLQAKFEAFLQSMAKS